MSLANKMQSQGPSTDLMKRKKYTWFTEQTVHAAFLKQPGDFNTSIYFTLRFDPRQWKISEKVHGTEESSSCPWHDYETNKSERQK